MRVVDEVKGDDGQDVTCCNSACANDGLSLVLEMVCFLLLRSYIIVCKYVVENGFLSDGLFPSRERLLGMDNITTKCLSIISIAATVKDDGSKPAGTRGESSYPAQFFSRANQAKPSSAAASSQIA